MQGREVYLGVDIGKQYLDVARGQVWRRFGNERHGHKELVSWLRELGGSVRVICEASGGYERELVQVLQQSGILVSLVQASRVRQFARGQRAPGQDRSHRCAPALCLWGSDRP
jgi:transposase